jgi:hypothetical protein
VSHHECMSDQEISTVIDSPRETDHQRDPIREIVTHEIDLQDLQARQERTMMKLLLDLPRRRHHVQVPHSRMPSTLNERL